MLAEASTFAAIQDWVIRSNPSCAPGLVLIAGFVGAAATLWLYLREAADASRRTRWLLAAIRVAVIAFVMFFAQGLSIHPFVTEAPELIVLLDNSRSMSIADVETDRSSQAFASTRSRLDRARDLLLEDDAARLTSLDARFRLRLHTLDERLNTGTGDDPTVLRERLESLTPTLDSSPIASRIQQLVDLQRGRSTAAILVLTDGRSTDHRTLRQAARRARRAGIPLYPVGIGRDSLPLDLELGELFVDRTAFVGDLLTFDVTVMVQGTNRGRATLRLERADLSGPVQEKVVEFEGERTRVRMTHRATELGRHAYTITADPLEDEVELDNNHASVNVEILDETIHVLLVGAVPSYEFRHLKLSLSRARVSDASPSSSPFQLSTLLQDADPEFHQVDSTAISTFPANRTELLAYDVIILCDANPHLLRPGALNDVVDVVSHDSRGIVAIAGPHFMPFAYANSPAEALLPAELKDGMSQRTSDTFDEPFHVRPTVLGATTGFMQLADSSELNIERWQQLPPLYWSVDVGRLKPSVRLLATRAAEGAANSPLLMLHYVGSGKVLFHATDETHRWRVQAGAEWHNKYWAQAVRFLGRGKLKSTEQATINVDQRQSDLRNVIRVRTDFLKQGLAPESDSGVTVVLERHLGQRRRVILRRTPGVRDRFESVVERLAPGKYQAWLLEPDLGEARPACDFEVESDSAEMRRLTVDRDALRKAASESGGRFLTLEESRNLLDVLPRGEAERVESLTPLPIWNWWGFALICISLISLEWILRKKSGML